MSQNVTTPAAADFLRAGLYLFAEGEHSGARRLFRATVAVAPHNTLAWNNLAMAELACGLPDDAISSLRRSLDLDDAQPATWISLASALLQTNELDEAEAACRHALLLQPDLASAWHVLGIILATRHDYSGAAPCLARAIAAMEPDAGLFAAYGHALLNCGQLESAARAFAETARLDPVRDATTGMAVFTAFMARAASGDVAGAFALYDPPPADARSLFTIAIIYLDRSGFRPAARAVAEAWRARMPEDAEARHRCEVLGEGITDRIPAAFVTQHYDAYAERFEQHLVGGLRYDVPAMIGRELAAWGAGPDNDIVDLGCGTGLCGPQLRAFARNLQGVDLSTRMLQRAHARALYDALWPEDLLDFLARSASSASDVIVAADVLIYLGDLAAVFAGVARLLRPGGRFVFSVERAPDDATYVLQGCGRFTHAGPYLQRLAASVGATLRLTEIVVRREGGADVAGLLGVLQAGAAAAGPLEYGPARPG